MKKSIQKILLDSALIIFSVLFALLINEWRNNLLEKKRTRIVIENLKKEIKRNQTITTDFLEYHSSVYDTIKTIYLNGAIETTFWRDSSFYIYKVAPDGIVQESLSNLAWEIAKEEKITSRVNFEIASALFEVYDQQAVINQTIDRIIHLLNTREAQRKAHLRETVLLFYKDFNELTGQEEYLLYAIEEALKVLEK